MQDFSGYIPRIFLLTDVLAKEIPQGGVPPQNRHYLWWWKRSARSERSILCSSLDLTVPHVALDATQIKAQTRLRYQEITVTNESAKIAIVTGASQGIGKSIAKRLAQDGFSVVVNYAGNSATAEAVVGEIKSAQGEAVAVQCDISNESEVERLFKQTLDTYGKVDVVVNNAGIMQLSPIAKSDVAIFDKTIAINLRGAFLVMAQAAQHVSSGGRIIALSSSVLAKSFPTYGAYIASKAGVEGLVHVLANELRGRNITVNAVAPGPTGTALFLKGKTDAQIQELTRLAPLERLGQPEDIASVVSFLAGPDGAWVNSQILRANGGFA
jgi:3-oxoacyl-[acyl-carrier protein] reductase